MVVPPSVKDVDCSVHVDDCEPVRLRNRHSVVAADCEAVSNIWNAATTPPLPFCDSEMDCPATVSVAVRLEPLLAVTETVSDPLPVPLDALSVAKDALLDAVQAHELLLAVTVIVDVPVPLPSDRLVGDTVNVQALVAGAVWNVAVDEKSLVTAPSVARARQNH